MIPIGFIMAFAGLLDREKQEKLKEDGWLLCNGESVLVTDYNTLYLEIGDLYSGKDDQGYSFNLPDYRGLFLRGTDNKRNMDPDVAKRTASNGDIVGDKIGSYQTDAYKYHNHKIKAKHGSGLKHREIKIGHDNNGQNGSDGTTYSYPATENGGESIETRPKNINVNYFIRFKY